LDYGYNPHAYWAQRYLFSKTRQIDNGRLDKLITTGVTR